MVEFIGRESEQTELLTWCNDPAANPVRLMVGAGGIGKSRLAGKLMQRLEETGWNCAWVGEGHESEAWHDASEGTNRPVLLVVDYAETRTGLADLLRSIAETDDRTRVRVLLLARGAGEWRNGTVWRHSR